MSTIHDDLIEREPDRVPLPSLIHLTLGLLDRHARHGPAEAALISEIADLLGQVSRLASPPGESGWPAQPLTLSENRVLRYLYQKLGAHSRHDAVQRARAIGLLATSSGTP
jgi:LuxR family maltose regulon positive regulatory protein